MEVRICFRAEVTLSGDTLADIAKDYLVMNLLSQEALENGGEFIETLSVEKGGTHEDITNEFKSNYNLN